MQQELMPQACERCWHRKQKCDRAKPACQACQNAGTACIERRLGNALDPDDPEAHHSYIEVMKRRISTLESRLNAASPGVSPDSPNESSLGLKDAMHNSDASRYSPTTTVRSHTNRGSSNSRDHGRPQPHAQPQQHHDTLQTEMGFLSLAAMAGFTGDQISSTATISFQQLVQAVTCVSGSNALRSDGQNEAITGALGCFHRSILRQGAGSGALGLAATTSMQPLQSFLVLMQCSLPLVGAEEILDDYQQMSGADEQQFAHQAPLKIVRVYLAVAVGMLMGRDRRHTESFATLFVLNAYQFVPRVFFRASDAEAAQCLVLMTLLSIYSPFGGSAWHLLGLAMTRCMCAGMHTSRVSDHRSEDAGRRNSSRLFWTLYCFDALVCRRFRHDALWCTDKTCRILSTALERPFSIQDEDISCTVPSRSRSAPGLDDLHAWNIHQAKLLHEIRNNPSKGTLYHFSNYQHWKETAPSGPPAPGIEEWLQQYHFPCANCRVLLAIVHICDSRRGGLEMSIITDQAIHDFPLYFDVLERLGAPSSTANAALTSLDGIEIFCTAVALTWAMYHRAGTAASTDTLQTALDDVDRAMLIAMQKPTQLLTHAAETFSFCRELRDTLQRFSVLIASLPTSTDFETFMDGLDESVPRPTLRLMEETVEMKKRLSAN